MENLKNGELENLGKLWYIILDIDGVLITTPLWKPDKIHADGYSDFCEKCVQNLNTLTDQSEAKLIISSSRRKQKTLDELNTIFANRGVIKKITGIIPFSAEPKSRLDELTAYITDTGLENYLIIDDDSSLYQLPTSMRQQCVITTYALGFNEAALIAAQAILANTE